jgi:hypothetical protein
MATGAGVDVYRSYFRGDRPESMDASQSRTAKAVPSADRVAGVSMRHPLPDAGASAIDALPLLDQSDGAAWKTLADLFGEDPVARFVVRDALIERFVATVDNLPESKLPLDLRPIAPLEGRLVATQQSGETRSYLLTEQNYERYKPLLAALQFVETERLVGAYAAYYPLLQEAYERLATPIGTSTIAWSRSLITCL